MKFRIEIRTLPASWATALCNGDWSGLDMDPTDAAACRAWIKRQRKVIDYDMRRDRNGEGRDPYFTNRGPYRDVQVADYRLLYDASKGEG